MDGNLIRQWEKRLNELLSMERPWDNWSAPEVGVVWNNHELIFMTNPLREVPEGTVIQIRWRVVTEKPENE